LIGSKRPQLDLGVVDGSTRTKGAYIPEGGLDIAVNKMENTTDAKTTTVTEKIVKVPAEVGTGIVKGTETVAHETVRVTAETADEVLEAGKSAARDIAKASEDLARRIRAPTPVTTDAKPDTTVPTGALAAAVAPAA
jgi:hypothetical protein